MSDSIKQLRYIGEKILRPRFSKVSSVWDLLRLDLWRKNFFEEVKSPNYTLWHGDGNEYDDDTEFIHEAELQNVTDMTDISV